MDVRYSDTDLESYDRIFRGAVVSYFISRNYSITTLFLNSIKHVWYAVADAHATHNPLLEALETGDLVLHRPQVVRKREHCRQEADKTR